MMSQYDPAEGREPLIRATLLRSSIEVAAITAGVLVFTIVSAFVKLSSELSILVPPAALLGILSPVIGYRIYLAISYVFTISLYNDGLRCDRVCGYDIGVDLFR